MIKSISQLISVQLGTIGDTTIQKRNKKTIIKIENKGTEYFGVARNLFDSPIRIVSNFFNPLKKIIVIYKMNDQIILEHSNLTTESENPIIIFNLILKEKQDSP